MNALLTILLMLGGAVAVISMVGCFGLWNAFLLLAGVSWRAHLALWLGCVVAFTACALLTPRTVYFGEDGQMTFSDERVISQILD